MKICKINACDRKHYARGWCKKHYTRWYKHGDPNISLRLRESWKGRHLCIFDGCDKIRVARGYCKMHYNRLRRHGNPKVVRIQHKNKGHSCSVNKCNNEAKVKGMCVKHYKRKKKWGDPTKTYKDFLAVKLCKIDYCNVKTSGWGYCLFHYRAVKAKSNGDKTKSFEDLFGGPPYQCYLCGKTYDICTSEFFELDHIIPRSQNGLNLKDNVDLACIQCNQSKRNLTNTEFIELCHRVSAFHHR